jgi:hypothetical protein
MIYTKKLLGLSLLQCLMISVDQFLHMDKLEQGKLTQWKAVRLIQLKKR